MARSISTRPSRCRWTTPWCSVAKTRPSCATRTSAATWPTCRRRPRRRRSDARLESRQAIEGAVQRLVFLGEAKARQLLVASVVVERRQRDRGDADVAGEPAAEILFAALAHQRVVDALEIAALAGQQLETRLRQSGAEQVALALIKRAQLEVGLGVAHVVRQPVLHRRVD